MKLKTNFKPLAIFIASATLSACGGGGGGSSPPVVQSNPVPDVVVPLTNFESLGAQIWHDNGYTGASTALPGGATVAIIDSGAPGALDAGFDDIDYDISLKENVQYDVDGSGAIVKTADTVTYSGEPHGHEMAQVVGSITNGIAPDANIIHGNISDSIGSTNRVSLWKGIEWAANNNADVVNASFDFNGLSYVYDAGPNPGGYTAGEIEIESIAQLVMSKDMAIVHAAGNGFGFTASDGVYDISGSASAVKTALKSQLLIVGAMNETMDAVADYSNVAGSDVDTQDRFVMAPAASQTAGGTIYGTSPAAANVSGAIALMKSRWMNLGGRELTQIILDTADSTFSAYSAEIYGQGITDLNKAYAPIGSATFKYADGNAPIQAASFTLPAGFNDVSFQTAFVDSYERDYETSFTMTANKPTSKFTQQVLLAQTTPQKRVVALNKGLFLSFGSQGSEYKAGSQALGYKEFGHNMFSSNRQVQSLELTGSDFALRVSANASDFTGSSSLDNVNNNGVPKTVMRVV